MPTAAAKPCQEPASAPARPGLPPAYHHLYALLHTLRHLAAQQDDICTLLAEIQRTGKLTAPTRRELTTLLHDLPTRSLDAELDATLSALEP